TTDHRPDINQIADGINSFDPTVNASRHTRDTLTLRANGSGPLELRYVTNQPKTNILNDATSAPWTCLATLLQPHLIGIVTSWALRSLGAPFWYDMLKNLLKLRPAPAIAEERQRDDRAKDSTQAKKG